MTTSLPEFLLARIAEDEEAWRQSPEFRVRVDLTRVDMTMTERALEECAAKRAIVERLAAEIAAESIQSDLAYDVLRVLAGPYGSHPDYLHLGMWEQ